MQAWRWCATCWMPWLSVRCNCWCAIFKNDDLVWATDVSFFTFINFVYARLRFPAWFSVASWRGGGNRSRAAMYSGGFQSPAGFSKLKRSSKSLRKPWEVWIILHSEGSQTAIGTLHGGGKWAGHHKRSTICDVVSCDVWFACPAEIVKMATVAALSPGRQVG